MQCYLGEQGQGIRLLLRPGRHLHRRIGCWRPEGATALVERLSGRVEHPQEHRTIWRKPSPKQHGAVTVRVDVQRTARMLARGLAGLRLPVHLAPPLHDALHVDRGARPRHREQARLGLVGRDATERTDLGIGELTSLQSRRQRSEGAGYPNTLTSGARSQPHAPREPLGAGAKAGIPTATRVELADESQQPAGRGIEVGRQLGDLVAQTLQLRGGRGRGLQRAGRF